MIDKNLKYMGFSSLSSDEAEWLSREVLHCGYVDPGDIDPQSQDVAIVWPDIQDPIERLTAIRTCVQVLDEYRERGWASAAVLEAAQYIWAVCCREE
jgi:hypothetical protein